ncbi:non-histone chromosomal protein HMG-14-like [Heterocephalus glaber]|uniref:Non-histone chromosomal protein HMG-14-like n=1 Tax=Heterocephalus glaber TaxID=10181 RepID=A0AAX6RYZ5_HETGA|nr:non-histone chromosomal protein HMG-14-like [Heterocephalus glaber]
MGEGGRGTNSPNPSSTRLPCTSADMQARIAMVPKRKVGSAKGAAKEEPKQRLARLQQEPSMMTCTTKGDLPQKNKTKQNKKRQPERINLGTKKRKQEAVANQETKEDSPSENGETKNEENNEAEEKEAKPD